MTPTARTLTLLRRQGFTAEVVERWIPHINRRRDLFGFADVLGVHPRDRVFLLVQTTSLGNVAARLTKAKGRLELTTWLKAGGRFVVHGWFEQSGRWKVKVVEVAGDDLQDVVLSGGRPRRGRGERQRDLFDAPAPATVGAANAAEGVEVTIGPAKG